MAAEQENVQARPTSSLPSWLKVGALNVGLRAVTLASKFVLLLVMARLLAPADLGIYNLVTVSVALSMYLVGLEFYVFNTREILARERTEWPGLIRDQLVFHAIAYVGALPVLLVIFVLGLLPWIYAPWFFAILVIEHLSQEAYRLFLTLSRPLLANVVLLLRSGAWIYAVVAAMFLNPSLRGITMVWSGWLVGALLSLGLAAYFLRDLPWGTLRKKPIDWAWIRRGAMGSLPFLGSALALSGIDTLDRYFLKFHHGETLVGAYAFYATLANAVQVFLFTGVIMILYPRIIRSFQQGDLAEYRKTMRTMARGIILGLLALVTLASAGIFPVLWIVDKALYWQHMAIFWVLLGSVAAACLAMIPHYALYARGHDRALILSAVLALGVSALLNWQLVPAFGLWGAATSTLAANATVGLSKLAHLIYRERA